MYRNDFMTINVKEKMIEHTNAQKPYKLKTSQKIYLFFKGIVDWLIAFFVLVILFPFWIILAIIIKMDSKGPAIFKHSRIGKKRKLFKCWKFRSMVINAPKHIASENFDNADTYITKVGQFIRKTSLDEFAQLFNILSGKMSLIGYRPLIKKETEIDELRSKYGVYQIKPGITGWAQVNGRDLVSEKQKALYDRYYLEHVSLWLDIKIFFMTIVKIIKRADIKEGRIENQIEIQNEHEQEIEKEVVHE